MKIDQLATLTSLLSPYVDLGHHRLQTLCLLITSMVSARTVNLSHFAAERASEVLVASTCRRLQHFFQYVRPPEDEAAKVIVALSGAKPPWLLCLDRTNGKIGKKEANILMLAIVTQRFRIPLIGPFSIEPAPVTLRNGSRCAAAIWRASRPPAFGFCSPTVGSSD